MGKEQETTFQKKHGSNPSSSSIDVWCTPGWCHREQNRYFDSSFLINQISSIINGLVNTKLWILSILNFWAPDIWRQLNNKVSVSSVFIFWSSQTCLKTPKNIHRIVKCYETVRRERCVRIQAFIVLSPPRAGNNNRRKMGSRVLETTVRTTLHRSPWSEDQHLILQQLVDCSARSAEVGHDNEGTEMVSRLSFSRDNSVSR